MPGFSQRRSLFPRSSRRLALAVRMPKTHGAGFKMKQLLYVLYILVHARTHEAFCCAALNNSLIQFLGVVLCTSSRETVVHLLPVARDIHCTTYGIFQLYSSTYLLAQTIGTVLLYRTVDGGTTGIARV